MVFNWTNFGRLDTRTSAFKRTHVIPNWFPDAPDAPRFTPIKMLDFLGGCCSGSDGFQDSDEFVYLIGQEHPFYSSAV